MENFKESGIYSKQAHVKIPKDLYEEEHGRNGFFGRVSQLYHTQAPVSWTHIEGDLKPRFIPPMFENDSITKNNYDKILYNDDLEICVGQFKESQKSFHRNADADELFFIHGGFGKVETSYGHLNFLKGDYIVMPRGTTYKFFMNNNCQILKIESKSEFEQVSRGLLGPNALYDQSVIKTPSAEVGSDKDLNEYILKIKREGQITKVSYPFNPLTAVGWKGSVYPFILSIYDICPIMSHRYHIPPSGHCTFTANNFVICSFVARPLEDSKEKVLKVPFYHSNIDFDEVLFYHKGNFFSRDNVGAGALSFHPQGIHHGPHPDAFKNSIEKTHTDEFAVMIDTKNPLKRTKWFGENENKDYWKSWMAKSESVKKDTKATNDQFEDV